MTECDKHPEYQSLTTFFGKDWPARDSNFLPDLFTFDRDWRSQSLHSKHTSSVTTIRRDTVPHDAIDDEFPIFEEGAQPWDDEEPVDFDSVIFNTGFDHSCIHGLDRQLLLRPTDAFRDLCWTEAVVADNHTPRLQSIRLLDPIDYQSDPEDGDLTPTDGQSEETPFEVTKHFVHLDSISTTSTYSPLSTATDDDQHGKIPVVFLDAHFPVSNPDDSIHFFPVSPLARRRGAARKFSHSRIAEFCSNLPGRLIKSS
jgi:hypothetical protein